MEDTNEIFDFLKAVGFDEKCVADEKDLSELIKDGPKSKKFRDLIVLITDEIRVLANIDEKVSGDSEINDFMIELSGFLKEMQCPFQTFISGPVSQRFLSVESRLIIFDYLLTELMAIKMCHKLNPKPKEQVVIEVSESRAAASLQTIASTLNIGKPPSNIPVNVIFDKINHKLTEVLQKSGQNQLGTPLFNPDKPLKDTQWKRLEQLQKELDAEYDIRRQMLITRLDVTIQSFQWSDKTKGKEDKIAARHTANRKFLDSIQTGGHATDIVALLAARDDVAIIEKTSCANVRKNTQSSIQKHVMGRVPDRGGRAYEVNTFTKRFT
ncbi:Protein FAM98A [Pseudolycoriella hygida]|uniref:Protein FAM98A n=1 Tax=Pseudolycoriella hygida TaxID=35572 RepID=A0A9Q0MIH7_9DIPT|nr:Protein FAM98A [Pseudolycoriella hygida]